MAGQAKRSGACKYSLVIPVYNERENLQPLWQNIVSAMAKVGAAYEVILVDDGSSDGSRARIAQICTEDRRFRPLFFDRNYGQSSALAAGFRAAKGDVVITMDADLQVDAHDIPLLLARLDRFDLVCGCRLERADSWLRRLSSRVANAVGNRLTGEKIRDAGAPLKVFKRQMLENMIFFDGMHRFFPALVRLQGGSIAEVPVSHARRRWGSSKYNIRNRLFRALFDLLGVRWLKKRYLRYRLIEDDRS